MASRLTSYVTSLIMIGLLAFSVIAQAETHLARKEIIIEKQTGGQSVFMVEVADTEEARATGLMYRDDLADNAGMLFIWSYNAMRQFWMRNTFISLDILFFDEDGYLVHYALSQQPQSEDIISSLIPASYVLEIKAGQTKAHNITIGDRLLISE